MRQMRLPWLAAVVLCAGGCATSYQTEYYLFGGKVVDADSGEPIARAALYIAESEADFFKPPRVYAEEYSANDLPVAAFGARATFGRDAANRFLFLMADDNGHFQTIWRRDVIRHSFFPIAVMSPSPLRTISFAAGARGYSDRIVSVGSLNGGREFARNKDCARAEENLLAPIVLHKGGEWSIHPESIEVKLLMPRRPIAPSGKAGTVYQKAETAFRKKQWKEALALYDQALAAEPEQPLVWLFRLDTLWRLNRFNEALEEGKRYLDKYPHVGYAYTILSDCAYPLGDAELNRSYLIKAMQLDPEFWFAYVRLWQFDGQYSMLPEGWLPSAKVLK